jgi:hypothetical protein
MIVIFFNALSFLMIKHLSITTVIVISILGFGTIGLSNYATGQTTNSSNQTTNQTSTNITSNEGSGESAVKMHIDLAIKALESNDNSGAMMHLKEADKTSSGQEKIHIGEAIRALESNDNSGAMMHAQLAQ